MPENYGSSQPHVLNTEDRNWVNSVHLEDRPLLTSELNIAGQLASEQVRSSTAIRMPSGFIKKGAIRYSDSLTPLKATARSGEVITSSELTNAFFLASDGKSNLALVNGWVVNVSATGTPSGEDANLILMGDQSGSYTEFVFLEVWKEIVSYQSTIKKYGNQSSYAEIDNDLYREGVGVETSRRVQLKYRIRVEKNFAVDLNVNPDGFNSTVFARGGANSTQNKAFTNMGKQGDPGLWRAGNGTEGDKTNLNTVDGYVYAIPMFLVSRRKKSAIPFDPSIPSTMYHAGSKDGGSPLRPDGLYADVIYPSDIVDLRRLVAADAKTTTSLADRTLRSLANGTAVSTKGKVRLSTGGFDEAPGGTTLISSDKLSSESSVSTMGLVDSSTPRSSFCNAEVIQPGLVKVLPSTGWVVSSATTLSQYVSLEGFDTSNGIPSRVASSEVQGLSFIAFSSTQWFERDTDYSVTVTPPSPTEPAVIEVVIDTVNAPSEDWYFKYDVVVGSNGSNGFMDTPSKPLEQRIGSTINAELGNPVRLYKRDASYSVHDRIELLGVGYKDKTNLGQVAFIRSTETLGSAYFNFIGLSLPGTGQSIIGVRSVQRVQTDGSLGDYLAGVSFELGEDTVTVRDIPTASGNDTDEVEVSFYLETKFFEVSPEGKGVTKTLESALLEVSPTSNTNEYTFHTRSLGNNGYHKTLLNICGILEGPIDDFSYNTYVLEKSTGLGDPFVSVRTSNLDVPNDALPMFSQPDLPVVGVNPTQMTWNQGYSFPVNNEIKVGVFTTSWLVPSDGTSYFVYNTKGYQGFLLDVTMEAEVLAEGPAILTDSGTGKVCDNVLAVPTVNMPDRRTVLIYDEEVGRSYAEAVLAGDYFSPNADSFFRYRVQSVEEGVDAIKGMYTSIRLFEKTLPTDAIGDLGNAVFYKHTHSTSSPINVVGRMPSLSDDDWEYQSGGVGKTTHLKPSSISADPLSSGPEGVLLGSGSTVKRGKSDLDLVAGGSNEKVTIFYQGQTEYSKVKVFQSYLVQDKDSGRQLVAIVAAKDSSGSDSELISRPVHTSLFRGEDVVDLFEIEGRVIFRA